MVIRILLKSFSSIHHISRCFSTKLFFKIEQLNNRSLLKISGEDIYPFLQGLITNDIYQLHTTKTSLFTFFLNNKGRILYDALLYRKNEHEILLECDSLIKDELIKHLKMYRVRKKINIDSLNDSVWVIYNTNDLLNVSSDTNFKNVDKYIICSAPLLKGDPEYEKLIREKLDEEHIILFKDPRIYLLGVRILVPTSKNIIKIISDKDINIKESEEYKILRYKLGVAEGIKELPPGNCFPLEANCDYLHGVSFHKGCYVGQELTARTHHTGVIRKRLMPLILSSVPEHELELESIIKTEGGKEIGKLRGIFENHAVALLRIAEALENVSKLKISGVPAFTYKPFWWPQEHKFEIDSSSSSRP